MIWGVRSAGKLCQSFQSVFTTLCVDNFTLNNKLLFSLEFSSLDKIDQSRKESFHGGEWTTFVFMLTPFKPLRKWWRKNTTQALSGRTSAFTFFVLSGQTWPPNSYPPLNIFTFPIIIIYNRRYSCRTYGRHRRNFAKFKYSSQLRLCHAYLITAALSPRIFVFADPTGNDLPREDEKLADIWLTMV